MHNMLRFVVSIHRIIFSLKKFNIREKVLIATTIAMTILFVAICIYARHLFMKTGKEETGKESHRYATFTSVII